MHDIEKLSARFL
ncbi:Protein of unknown function [Bacillus cereus]|nr:Protein of unknown function [Bacillus cereus]